MDALALLVLFLTAVLAQEREKSASLVETVKCTSGHSCTATCDDKSPMKFDWNDEEVDHSLALARALVCCYNYKNTDPPCRLQITKNGISGKLKGEITEKLDCMPFIRSCKAPRVKDSVDNNGTIHMSPIEGEVSRGIFWEYANARGIDTVFFSDHGVNEKAQAELEACTKDGGSCKFEEFPSNFSITGLHPCMYCKERGSGIADMRKYFMSTGQYEKCIIRCSCGTKKDLVDVYYRSQFMDEWPMEPKGETECWGQSNKEYYADDYDTKMTSLLAAGEWNGKAREVCAPVHCNGDYIRTVHIMSVQNIKMKMIECSTCVHLRYPEDCKINIKSDMTGVVVDFEAVAGTYSLKLGDYSRKGDFMDAITERIPVEGAFKDELKGYCNNQRFKRQMSFTLDEYCNNQYQGIQWIPSKVYCKNKHTLFWLLIALISIAIAYVCRAIMSTIISAALSVTVGSFLIMCKKTLTCPICKKFRMNDRCHRCNPTSCTYCGEQILNEGDMMTATQQTIRDIQASHERRCRSPVSKSQVFLAYLNMYRMSNTVLNGISTQSLRVAFAIVGFWIISMMLPGAWAESLEDTIGKAVEEEMKKDEKKFKIVIDFHLKNWEQVVLFTGVALSAVMMFSALMACIPATVLTFLLRVFCNKTHICQYCYGLFDRRLPHHCRRVICPGCTTEFGPMLEGTDCTRLHAVRARHMSQCTKDFTLEGVTRRKYASYIRHNTLRASGAIALMMVIFMLTICAVNSEEKSELDDRGVFSLPKDPVNFGKVAMEKIGVIDQKTRCGAGQCKTMLVMESTMVARKGRAFGYEIIPSEKLDWNVTGNPTVIFKVEDAYVTCKYKEVYKTGRPTHFTTSFKTCSANTDCNYCHSEFDALGNVFLGAVCRTGWCDKGCVINDPGTNKWACDGNCWIAGGGGCTCGKCLCHLTEPTHTVLKKESEEPQIRLCYDFGGKIRCANLNRETRAGDVFVIKTGDSTNHCPSLIVKHEKEYLTGPINDWGEFDGKFGTFQAVGEPNMKDFNAGARCDVDWHEKCEFGHDAQITINRCCMDTFDMVENLETIHPIWSDESQDILRMRPEDVGTWNMKVHMPDLVYHQKSKDNPVKEARIVKCKGCYSCNEGGSCDLEIKSNLEASVSLSCTQCNLDKGFIHVTPGVSTVNFNVFCKSEKVSINCTIADRVFAAANISLDEAPKVPHGDSVINVDPGMMTGSQECQFLGCVWKTISDFFSGPWAWVKWVLMGVVAIIALIIMVKIAQLMYVLIKAGSPNGKKEKDIKVYYNDRDGKNEKGTRMDKNK